MMFGKYVESSIEVGQLLAATRGTLHADPSSLESTLKLPLGRISIDSRACRPGDVFWALPGDARDGNDFVDDAYSRGAKGVICSRLSGIVPQDRYAVQVSDSKNALAELAKTQRDQFAGTVIAVTGSVGKTTTREFIDTVLASCKRGTASPHNFNNLLGLPLSLLRWRSDDDYAVVEIGANHQGEVGELAKISRPHVGVISNIGDAHLGKFGSREIIAQSKSELLSALPRDGLAVLNGDDPMLRRVWMRSQAEVRWVGRGADCDLTATDIMSRGGKLSFTVAGHRVEAPVVGRHHVVSILAALAVGRHLELPWKDMIEALRTFVPPPARCQVQNIGPITVINDSYNSSPLAMNAALQVLREFDTPGRRIVVCGDMQELGQESNALHYQVGRTVVTHCGADLLIVCGESARRIADGANDAGMAEDRIAVTNSPIEAAERVHRVVRPHDTLLVKSSRSVGMERCVSELRRLVTSRSVAQGGTRSTLKLAA